MLKLTHICSNPHVKPVVYSDTHRESIEVRQDDVLVVTELGSISRTFKRIPGIELHRVRVTDFEGGKTPLGLISLVSPEKSLKTDPSPQKTTDLGYLGVHKMLNPKHLIGSSKLPLYLWPPIATAHGCLGLWEGMNKYGRTNWRASEVAYVVYIAATIRHLYHLLEGEDDAQDSKLDHWDHILANAAIVLDARMVGTLVDDRNYAGQNYGAEIARLTEHVKRIEELHKDKNPKQWTIQDNART